MDVQSTVVQFNPAQHSHLVAYLAALHAGCITHDRTLATFLPPLSHEKLLTWWKERIAEVNGGTRVIHILLKNTGTRPLGTDLIGVVMLSMPFSETGKGRGVVEKLLVQQGHRGKGSARLLVDALEADALRRGRTMLVGLPPFSSPNKTLMYEIQTLDTETGSNAEKVYRKLGWVEVGRIPKYGVSPDGELKDETFFYKQL